MLGRNRAQTRWRLDLVTTWLHELGQDRNSKLKVNHLTMSSPKAARNHDLCDDGPPVLKPEGVRNVAIIDWVDRVRQCPQLLELALRAVDEA